jgi:hypothetical protein
LGVQQHHSNPLLMTSSSPGVKGFLLCFFLLLTWSTRVKGFDSLKSPFTFCVSKKKIHSWSKIGIFFL